MRKATSVPADQHAFPRRLLLWAFGIALAIGLLGLGELAEDALRIARNRIAPRHASGEIVVVRFDDAALARFGLRPSGEAIGAMIDAGRRAGSPQMLFDIKLEPGRTEAELNPIRAAIARHGAVGMAVTVRLGRDGRRVEGGRSMAERVGAEPVDISVPYNYANIAWAAPYGSTLPRRHYRSLSNAAAGRTAPRADLFPIDWTIDPLSVPTIGLTDLVDGHVAPGSLRGRTLVLGSYTPAIADEVYSPGYGRIPGVLVHVVAAETLRRGDPRWWGWPPLLLLAAAVLVAVARHATRYRARMLALATLAMPLVALPAERAMLVLDVVPAMMLLATAGAMLVWRRHRLRGLTDALTGHPNFNALRAARETQDRPLVACRVVNYTQILATLRGDDEALLARQILARLTLGAGNQQIYVGDDGLFAWFCAAPTGVVAQIEALQALFRSPVSVLAQPFDVAVSFGIEIGSGGTTATRLGRALASADDAHREGLKYLVHDPERIEDMSWRLSLLGQIDRALTNGEMWVAYQPQIEVATGRVVGAEALARWTHPEKGPIAPTEFVAAAEQGDRIDRLTEFVLDDAVATAAAADAAGQPIDMAVNLSARLLGDHRLPLKIAAVLARHRLPPARLTLELTETAAMADSSGVAMLARIRDLGVKISIDDYGTGLSTLEYLKTVPASELKIDQSFIRAMADNRSDRLLVQSTIALAHSLGRTVVAEGVESAPLLDLLERMGCDRAQGYHIARPGSAATLLRRLRQPLRRQIA